MSTGLYESNATSVGGWTCWNCKAFVPNGCTHHCPTTVVGSFPQPQLPPQVDLRIAVALERIAAALEALSKDEDC